MPKINVYLPDDLAEDVRKHELPVSAICQAALKKEIEKVQTKETTGMEEITVDLGDQGRSWRESFVGRWLVHEHPGVEVLGIALTKRGKFAVYTYNDLHGVGFLDVYDSLAEIAQDNDRFPEELIAEAAGELGEDYVIRRDI